MRKLLTMASIIVPSILCIACSNQDQAIDDRQAGIDNAVKENAKNRAPGEGPGN